MDLHHQAVLAGHLGHLEEHVRRERVDLGLARLRPVEHAGVELAGCVHLHRSRVGQ